MSWMGNAKEGLNNGYKNIECYRMYLHPGGGEEMKWGGDVQGEMSGGDIDIKARYKRLLTQF